MLARASWPRLASRWLQAQSQVRDCHLLALLLTAAWWGSVIIPTSQMRPLRAQRWLEPRSTPSKVPGLPIQSVLLSWTSVVPFFLSDFRIQRETYLLPFLGDSEAPEEGSVSPSTRLGGTTLTAGFQPRDSSSLVLRLGRRGPYPGPWVLRVPALALLEG